MPRPIGAGCDVGAVEMPEPLFATEVPTLDAWGVLVFALLLAGAAIAHRPSGTPKPPER